MSLLLQQGTVPDGLSVKTFGIQDDTVNLTADDVDIQISFDDMCCMIEYFLTNTEIKYGDPRYELIENVKRIKPDMLTGRMVMPEGRYRARALK